jgi:hypothetical protein
MSGSYAIPLLTEIQQHPAEEFAEINRYVLPLGDRRISRYFADALFIAHRFRERAARPLLRTFPEVLSQRRKNAAEAPPIPQSTSCIALRDYEGSARKRTVLFVFRENEPNPSYVLKIRSLSAPGRSLREESNILRVLSGRLRSAKAPKPLEYTEGEGFEMLLLEALPGRSAYVEMQSRFLPRRFVRRHFLAAARWIASFHAETRVQGRFCDSLNLSLPLSACHGDFWARNLLLTDAGDAAVVDWEDARLEAPPFIDLFHFPLTYGLNYRWSRGHRLAPLAAFEKTFLDDNVVSRSVRMYFSTYCALRGLDPRVLRTLFDHFLIERSSQPSQDGQIPWLQFSHLLKRANRYVFSG